MKTPEIILVTLSNQDTALFVNGDAILALEAGEKGIAPASRAAALASALGVALLECDMQEPAAEDWSWNDVYAAIPAQLKRPSEEMKVYAGYLTIDGVTHTIQFAARAGATRAEQDAAFMAVLAQQAEIDYLEVGVTDDDTPGAGQRPRG